MKLKIKKLSPEAKIPQYAKEGDAGLDLIAISVNSKMQETRIPGKPHQSTYAFKYLEFGTGLSVEIPKGHVGLIFPRSSISETSMDLSNAVGVIDSGYRGEIKFRFRNVANGLDTYKVGDKVGQLLIVALPTLEVEEANDLSVSERGTDGFGSSGK